MKQRHDELTSGLWRDNWANGAVLLGFTTQVICYFLNVVWSYGRLQCRPNTGGLCVDPSPELIAQATQSIVFMCLVSPISLGSQLYGLWLARKPYEKKRVRLMRGVTLAILGTVLAGASVTTLRIGAQGLIYLPIVCGHVLVWIALERQRSQTLRNP